jgi:hypothetical protein
LVWIASICFRKLSCSASYAALSGLVKAPDEGASVIGVAVPLVEGTDFSGLAPAPLALLLGAILEWKVAEYLQG